MRSAWHDDIQQARAKRQVGSGLTTALHAAVAKKMVTVLMHNLVPLDVEIQAQRLHLQ